MSQRAVEAVLGRMITDLDFRGRFLAEPAMVCRENEIVLTPRETAALLRVDSQLLDGLADGLDAKIVRAASVTQSHAGEFTGAGASRVLGAAGSVPEIRRG